MKIFVEPSFAATVQPLLERLSTGATEGWSKLDGEPISPATAAGEAFRVGAKYLFWTDYGKALLKEWRDTDVLDPEKPFEGMDGHLKNFKGRSTVQLLRHYLSLESVAEAEWIQTEAWTTEDGRFLIRLFRSWRAQDAWAWVQEAETGRGVAVARHS